MKFYELAFSFFRQLIPTSPPYTDRANSSSRVGAEESCRFRAWNQARMTGRRFLPCSPVYNVCIIVHINKRLSMDIGFIWDEEQYQQVVANHHVRFYEVISAFEDRNGYEVPDPAGHADRWM